MKASDGQSFFDLAVLGCGSAESALLIAMKNGLSVTDTLSPGQTIELTAVSNADIAAYFADRGVTIATGAAELLYHDAPPVVITQVGSTVFVGDSIKAMDNQSLFDVAVERLGTAEAALDLAIKNGVSVTDALSPGQTIELTAVSNADIAAYFTDRAIKPCTGTDIENGGGELALEGIGYWAIGIDFVVS